MSGFELITQRAVAIVCVLLFPFHLTYGQAPEAQQPAPLQQPAQLLSPDQLDNLVAPVALYPDPLLGQVLAASTYPLEVAEANQWLQQNRNLQGAQRVDAARQQNWDPSVQALVAFPDALSLLGNDLRWTTDLGNAFLAQQADVMSAVQRMRARASANGRLQSTQQQVVTTDNQNGQSAIEIQPANPQVIYVPVYQPEYVWGPPVVGVYPDLWYPPGFGFGFGFGFAPGIYIGAFFPGWGGWGGWGWGCGWFGGGLFVNVGFFNHYGFRGGFGGGGFGGRTAWTHDAAHRMGVSYPNRAVAARFNSNNFRGNGSTGGRFAAGNRATGGQFSGGAYSRNGGSYSRVGAGNGGSYRQGSSNYAARAPAQGYRAPAQSYRGFSGSQQYRTSPAYNRAYSAPRSYASAPRQSFQAQRAQSYSAPRSYASAPRQSFQAQRAQSYSAPRSLSGGARSSGFSGGGHAGFSGGGGGGHASGGGGGHAGGGGGGRRR